MDVSIIIVSYNNLEILNSCIVSLYKHITDISFEVIIVDNGSDKEKIKEICNGYSNLKLILNEKNVGFAKANNIGLKIASGKYVLFLNNDTVFIENSIKKVFDYAEKNKNIILGCKLLNPDGSWQQSTANYPSLINAWSSNFFLYKFFPHSKTLNKYHIHSNKVTQPIEVDYVLGAFLFGSKKEIMELNGFDEKFFFYAEDIDLCYRYKKFGGKVIFYPLTSIIHIGGASVVGNQWFKLKNKFIAEIQFYQKHYKGLEFYLSILAMYFGNFLRIPIFFLWGLISLKGTHILRSLYHFKLLFIYPENLFK